MDQGPSTRLDKIKFLHKRSLYNEYWSYVLWTEDLDPIIDQKQDIQNTLTRAPDWIGPNRSETPTIKQTTNDPLTHKKEAERLLYIKQTQKRYIRKERVDLRDAQKIKKAEGRVQKKAQKVAHDQLRIRMRARERKRRKERGLPRKQKPLPRDRGPTKKELKALKIAILYGTPIIRNA